MTRPIKIWTCPTGCRPKRVFICGGHHPRSNEPDDGNIYFYGKMCEDQTDFEYTKDLHSGGGPLLSDDDWDDIHSHADSGGATEPQCEECADYMNHTVEGAAPVTATEQEGP